MFITAFLLNSQYFIVGFAGSDILFSITVVVIIRVAILTFNSLFLFKKWFSQEQQYVTDIPFLIAIFLYILIFGKAMDLFTYIVYEIPEYSIFETLIVIKVRYFIIVLNAIPLIYLGLGIYLFAKKKDGSSESVNKLRRNILITYIVTFSSLTIFAPTIEFLQSFLGILVTFSVFTIAWMFLFAYKQKRLSQINPLIVSVGFIMYVISSVFRSIVSVLFPLSKEVIQFCFEIVDIVLYVIIFIGFITPAKYDKPPIMHKEKIDQIEATPTSSLAS